MAEVKKRFLGSSQGIELMMVREFIVSGIKNRECLDAILAALAETISDQSRLF